MISQRTVQEIRETAQIKEVVEDFLNLKKRGSGFVGLCPFHDEKTPSFSVSPTKNFYHCFGCGRSGDAVQFIREHENYSFTEALRYLAGKYQIKIEETESSPRDKEAEQKVESLHLINRFAHSHFQDQLFNSPEGQSVGLTYFKERGYLESTIRKFELGYATSSFTDLLDAALAKGYDKAYMSELGLLTKNGKDFFRERVVFPIHNYSGKVIGFGARTLRTDKKLPKYLNSPESPVYQKSKTLYGLYFARQAIRKKDSCILVEGYTDVLSLAQSGIENVVASSGTALTVDQVKAIKRYTPNITILYDSDPAGIKAALRGLDMILEQDMHVLLALLPEGEDPDSLIRKLGNEGFTRFLDDNAKDFILFKADVLHTEAKNDPIRKTRVIRDIVSTIAIIPDPIKRAMYIQECSRVLNIEEAILVSETNGEIRERLRKERFRRPQQSQPQSQMTPMPHEPVPQPHAPQVLADVHSDEYQERDIVRLLFSLGHKMYDVETGMTLAQYIYANLSDVMDAFENPLYQKCIADYSRYVAAGQAPSPQDLVTHADDEIRTLAIDILSSPHEYSKNWEEQRGMPLQTQKEPEENFMADSYQSILRFKQRKILKKLEENKLLLIRFEEAGDQENFRLHGKIHQELQKTRADISEKLKNVLFYS